MTPWLRHIKLPTGSPTRIVRRAELLAIFKRIADIPLDVENADVAELPGGGISIKPRAVEVSSTPGLTVSVASDNPPRLAIEPSYINGVIPKINGVFMTADPPPLLDYTGADDIVLVIDLDGTVPDRIYPVTTSGYRIGWRRQFSAERPTVTFDTALHDADPPNPAADDTPEPVITPGRWLIPIATVTSGGIRQYLTSATTPGNITIDTGTSQW